MATFGTKNVHSAVLTPLDPSKRNGWFLSVSGFDFHKFTNLFTGVELASKFWTKTANFLPVLIKTNSQKNMAKIKSYQKKKLLRIQELVSPDWIVRNCPIFF